MENLSPPLDFSFPFSPYGIQEEFMKTLFKVLENGNLGIFESPTGTGKSLSLICGALTWLNQHNDHHKKNLEVQLEQYEKSIQESNESFDWFENASKTQSQREETKKITTELNFLKLQEERISELKKRRKVTNHKMVKKVDNDFDELFKDLEDVRAQVKKELDQVKAGNYTLPEDEAEFLLDDYESDSETNSKNRQKDNEEEDEDKGCLKIYFCSRTHSQLSQFVRELQKTQFSEDIRVVSLASRQNLCINEDVTRLNNVALLNERCIDLQSGKKGKSTCKTDEGQTKKKKKTSNGCPFYKQSAIQTLSDQLLLEVQDIEQSVTYGRKINACPYYASRFAIKDAQVVVLPYNTLLHKGTREACKINLKNNVVIVDEAHNLLETIANIHSVIVSYTQLTGCHSQLSQYLDRYEKRLTPQNLLYIKQIIFFTKAVLKLLTGKPGVVKNQSSENKTESSILKVDQFLSTTLTDNLNLFKIIQYIEKSKISHKLHGFSQKYEGQLRVNKKAPTAQSGTSSFLSKMSQPSNKENTVPETNAAEQTQEMVTGSPLIVITELMKALLSASVDGRIITSVDSVVSKSSIKYLLLNPSSHFHDIVKDCRSVIVAGGTMRPMSEFRDQLFISANAAPSRITEFSCGHVVEGTQLLPLVLPSGPSNTQLDFTFQKRNDKVIMDELARVIINICNIVPGGIVVFLPSYDYEKKVFQYLLSNGHLNKIGVKKKVFREPKKSSDLDKVLGEYSKVIKNSSKNTSGLTGALVFSVVGGKLSEGINFSDDLGRCVLMVGLPYPNSFSPELKEKMDHLNRNIRPNSDGKTAGAIYYENLCFKAVNQSIGRAIRHRNDYACIILADYRYNRTSSVKALPEWISKHLHQCQKFGEAFGLIRKFFAAKKEDS